MPKLESYEYFKVDDNVLYNGDCLHVMREMPDESIDLIVSDPPYGLEFMGKEWDKFILEKKTKNQVVKGLPAGQKKTNTEQNQEFQILA